MDERSSAIGPDAVRLGVTRDAKYERLAADIHGYGTGSGVEHRRLEEQVERIVEKCTADRARYLEEIDARGLASRLIVYLRDHGMQRKDAEIAGVERFLSLAPGVYRGMWKFIDAGHTLDAAILAAEGEITRLGDIAERSPGSTGEPSADTAKESMHWSEREVEDLMDARKKTRGHSRSGGRRRGRPPKFHDDEAHYQEVVATSEMRREMVAGRVSKPVKAYLEASAANASAGEVVEVVVQAMIAGGCGLGTIKAWLDDAILRATSRDVA